VSWALTEDDVFGAPLDYVSDNPVSFELGGEGPRTVFAVFFDDVGNSSVVTAASIVVDTEPPDVTATALTIASPSPVPGYTNSVSASVQARAPEGAVSLALAPAADTLGCTDADLSGELPQQLRSTYSFLLPPGDGDKLVCGRFYDAAGNGSALLEAHVVLDTQAPTTPLLVTPPTLLGLRHGAVDEMQFTVETFEPVFDENFYRYERQGGHATTWVADNTDPAATSFVYSLVASDAAQAESGVQNILKLRAVDAAGNIGPEVFVVVTTDINPPEPVEVRAWWVMNGDGRSTLYWNPPAGSPDVVGYKIHYGHTRPRPGFPYFGGSYAAEGISPITIGNANHVTLTGLINDDVTYASVSPIDRAGNEGEVPTHPEFLPGCGCDRPVADTVMLQPAEYPVSPVIDVPLAFTPRRLARSGRYVYALGIGEGTTYLQAINLGEYASAIEYGELDVDVPVPSTGAAVSFSGDVTVAGDPPIADMLLDGMFLFVASGSRVRIFSLYDPMLPRMIAAIDLATLSQPITRANSLALRGQTLFIADSRDSFKLAALDLKALYDTNPALPGVSDVIGVIVDSQTAIATNGDGMYQRHIALARNTVAVFSTWPDMGRGYVRHWFVNDAVDGNPGTTWEQCVTPGNPAGCDGALEFNQHGFGRELMASQVVAGRYLYSFDETFKIFNTGPLWTGGQWSSGSRIYEHSTEATFGQGDMLGKVVVYPVRNGLGDGVRILEIERAGINPDTSTTMNIFNDHGIYRARTGTTYAVLIDNTDLLMAADGVLHVARLVFPRSLSISSYGAFGHSLSGAGAHLAIGPGALYTSTTGDTGFGGARGGAWDLIADEIPRQLGEGHACAYDMVMFDETSVTSWGNVLQIVNLDDAIDRDNATVLDWNDPTERFDFGLPPGTYASSLAAVGGQLVVLEYRVDDGTYLEVFDAGKIRDRIPTTNLSAADSRGAYKVSSTTCAATDSDCIANFGHSLRLEMHGGRALVTVDGLRIIDLRPLLDEDPATVMTAASDQGRVPDGVGWLDLAPHGNHVFGVTANAWMGFGGTWTADISAAMDEDPETVVDESSPRQLTGLGVYTRGLAATGNYAFLANTYAEPWENTFLYVMDISRPMAPRILASLPFKNSSWCGASSVATAGDRMYVLQANTLFVVRLE
jgi:hypothetical protein